MKRRNISNILATGLTAIAGSLLMTGCGGGGGPQVFNQFDRLARPAVNEVLATVANNRHKVNDESSPSQDRDPGHLHDDIFTFMRDVAGRSVTAGATTGISNVAADLLTPDVMIADLSKAGPAGYLGSEAAVGYGGRKLDDDIVDASLGAIFGATIPALGLAPDDGNEIPTLLSDNIGAGAKHFSGTFPYVGPPQ